MTREIAPRHTEGRLQNRLPRTFRSWFDDFWMPNSLFGAPFSGDQDFFYPASNVDETEKEYILSLDLPGVSKDDVSIEMQDNQLNISGERRHEKANGHRSEVFYGRFERRFTLPPNVDAENIEATYRNGVLELCLPKTEPMAGKKIEVKEGEPRKQVTEKKRPAA